VSDELHRRALAGRVGEFVKMNFAQARRVILAGIIGNVLEWYDFVDGRPLGEHYATSSSSGVIDAAVATKEDAAALQSLLERTTALPRTRPRSETMSPNRTSKIFCSFIQAAHYLGEFLPRGLILFSITDVAKSPHHDFAR
jgi:hypothetical protein